MKKPRVYIEQEPRGWFKIYRLETYWFGLREKYKLIETTFNLESAEKVAEICINPIVKEYE